MWYSESHPSQKPTLISYDEFLKITNPGAEDVGATSRKRPEAVALHLHYSHRRDYNQHFNSELSLPFWLVETEIRGEFCGKGSTKGEGKRKLKKHSKRLLPPTPHSQSPRRKRLEGKHNDA